MATKPKKETKSTKKKRKTSSSVKSFQKRLDEYTKKVLGGDGYIRIVEKITDKEALEKMFPENNAGKIIVSSPERRIACDSAFCGGATPQYNAPIPLGFHTPSPETIPMKGIIGNAIKHFSVRNFFIGFQVNAWAKQNCFISKACDMPGNDAVSCGYEFKLNVPRGTKSKDVSADNVRFKFDSEEFNLEQAMRNFESNKRCYGGALAIPCFEEEVDMSSPLVDYSQLKGKTFLGWTIIDPYYLAPEFGENDRSITDPSYKHFLEPTWWNIYGSYSSTETSPIRRIHRSWCFFRRNIITASIYRPTYLFFSPSVPQMVLERLYSAEMCANEAAMLLRSKRSFVVEADIRRMIANPQWAEQFLRHCSENDNNWGVRLVERGSNAKQMDTLLSECMPLTMAQYGILCAEVGIPAPKFMMAQLTGFANSGNYEIKLYADMLRQIQHDDLTPFIKKTVAIETACLTGVAYRSDIEFGKIDIPTISEESRMLFEEARAQKMIAESKAVTKLANAKSAESHKSVKETAE
jgi:hypothetical protein